jgi:hypothetical protein
MYRHPGECDMPGTLRVGGDSVLVAYANSVDHKVDHVQRRVEHRGPPGCHTIRVDDEDPSFGDDRKVLGPVRVEDEPSNTVEQPSQAIAMRGYPAVNRSA